MHRLTLSGTFLAFQIPPTLSFLSYGEQRKKQSNTAVAMLHEHCKPIIGVKLVEQVQSIKNNNEIIIHFKLCQTTFSSHGAWSDTCLVLYGFIHRCES